MVDSLTEQEDERVQVEPKKRVIGRPFQKGQQVFIQRVQENKEGV